MRLLALLGLWLALPAWVQAQFSCATNDGAITITGYSGPGGAVIIPSEINGLPVTGIGNAAFYGGLLTGVTIPESVTIPGSVTSIGFDAFQDCGGLASLALGNGVTSIGDAAFGGCTSLTSVTIPDSVTNIGGSAFFGCSLTSVTIPNGVTSIGGGTFFDCTSLASVTIPEGVTSFGSDAFELCVSLAGVTIPNSVTNIGASAFSGCSSLASIAIPDSVTSIGEGALGGCARLAAIAVDTNNPAYASLAGVLFDKSQTTLIQYPMGNEAKSYTIPGSVRSIGTWAFGGCSNLTSITIPDGVTNIGFAAFNGCANLAGITIPSSVTSIGDAAFEDCTNLASVTIPGSVGSVADWAFEGCTRLQAAYFQGGAPSGDSTVFAGDPVTVYHLPGTTGWASAFGGLPNALWQPQVQVQTGDGSFGVRTNRFGFDITSASGMTVAVDVCTNLANPTWYPLQTNIFTSNRFYFSDPQWTNYPARFYRLRTP